MCVTRSVVSDSVTLWTVARQAPLSMGFSREEYWSGMQFPSLGVFPAQGSNLHLWHSLKRQVDSSPLCHLGRPARARVHLPGLLISLSVLMDILFPSETDYLVALATVCLDLPVTEPFLRHLIAHPGALSSRSWPLPIANFCSRSCFFLLWRKPLLSLELSTQCQVQRSENESWKEDLISLTTVPSSLVGGDY